MHAARGHKTTAAYFELMGVQVALLDPAGLLGDCGQAGNGSLLGSCCSLCRLRLGPQHSFPLPLPQLTMQLLVLCLHQHTFPFHLQSHCLLGEDETSCCVNGFVSRQLPALDQHGNIRWDWVGDAGRHEPCLCGVSMLPLSIKHTVLQSDSGNFCISITVAYRCCPAWQPTQTGHGVQRCRWLFAVKLMASANTVKDLHACRCYKCIQYVHNTHTCMSRASRGLTSHVACS